MAVLNAFLFSFSPLIRPPPHNFFFLATRWWAAINIFLLPSSLSSLSICSLSAFEVSGCQLNRCQSAILMPQWFRFLISSSLVQTSLPSRLSLFLTSPFQAPPFLLLLAVENLLMKFIHNKMGRVDAFLYTFLFLCPYFSLSISVSLHLAVFVLFICPSHFSASVFVLFSP